MHFVPTKPFYNSVVRKIESNTNNFVHRPANKFHVVVEGQKWVMHLFAILF